ncbi:diaminopimelate decarboxylase family protein, partial [Chloroflexota bacterium]
AVALYTVGSLKEIPGVRKYICVDGGMGDNIRPALYEAQYEVLVANRISDDKPNNVTIAGKYCESGDILAKDASMAPVSTGDIIAIPVSGAYSIPMSSNYNMIPRPAIAMVKDGKARLIRKRENYKDLMRLDLT